MPMGVIYYRLWKIWVWGRRRAWSQSVLLVNPFERFSGWFEIDTTQRLVMKPEQKMYSFFLILFVSLFLYHTLSYSLFVILCLCTHRFNLSSWHAVDNYLTEMTSDHHRMQKVLDVCMKSCVVMYNVVVIPFSIR